MVEASLRRLKILPVEGFYILLGVINSLCKDMVKLIVFRFGFDE